MSACCFQLARAPELVLAPEQVPVPVPVQVQVQVQVQVPVPVQVRVQNRRRPASRNPRPRKLPAQRPQCLAEPQSTIDRLS